MYKYNEKEYANHILQNGFSNKHMNTEMKILAKYFKEMGYKPLEREKLLYDFCEKNIKNFSRIQYFKKVNSALNYARKNENKLIVINEIGVTEEELNYIDNLDLEHIYKKVLFTLIVLTKLNKKVQKIKHPDVENNEFYFGGNPHSYKELVDSAKIPSGKSKKIKHIHDIIGDLHDKGIIEIRTNGFIKLLFMYETADKGSIIIKLNTFDNIGYYYSLHLNEENIIKCEKCRLLLKSTNNKTKYCHPCSKEIKKEQNRVADQKYKEKKRMARK